MHGNCNLSITAPLPGWIRFEHQRTGRTLDFNPDYDEHRRILLFYERNPDWRQVATHAPCDVEDGDGSGQP